MKKEFMKSNRGSVSIFTMLIFLFVILVFSAVVIDVGFVYSTRKQMITSADAAALAGAKEMEKTLSESSESSISQIKARAITIAKNIAIENGAQGEPEVVIEKMNIKLADGTTDYRDVIKVKVTTDEKLIFFRFIDKFNLDVNGVAIATWGYVTNVTAGQLLPLYTTPDLFLSSNTLHSGKMSFNDSLFPNQRGYIYLDPAWNGQNIINEAIEGVPTKITLALDTVFEGKSGVAQSVIGSVETRMKNAQKLETPTDRRAYMYGLVPIAEFYSSSGNTVYFQIKSFAVYEIIDVMTKTNTGSPEALLGSNYTKIGTGKTYSPADNEGNDYEKGTIYGKFTGEVRELEVIIEKNDQDGNILTITSGAKYSKLIQ
ncbi:MAG: pilus assembly protein TadG-related protein [Firmicutes bacterium]|nr:pilus assembly protein TadG-related protein [Bacillota bacterium]